MTCQWGKEIKENKMTSEVWQIISWNSRQQEIACFANRTEMLEYVSDIPRSMKIRISLIED